MKPMLHAIVLAAALLFQPAAVRAAETITVYKDAPEGAAARGSIICELMASGWSQST